MFVKMEWSANVLLPNFLWREGRGQSHVSLASTLLGNIQHVLHWLHLVSFYYWCAILLLCIENLTIALTPHWHHFNEEFRQGATTLLVLLLIILSTAAAYTHSRPFAGIFLRFSMLFAPLILLIQFVNYSLLIMPLSISLQVWLLSKIDGESKKACSQAIASAVKGKDYGNIANIILRAPQNYFNPVLAVWVHFKFYQASRAEHDRQGPLNNRALDDRASDNMAMGYEAIGNKAIDNKAIEKSHVTDKELSMDKFNSLQTKTKLWHRLRYTSVPLAARLRPYSYASIDSNTNNSTDKWVLDECRLLDEYRSSIKLNHEIASVHHHSPRYHWYLNLIQKHSSRRQESRLVS